MTMKRDYYVNYKTGVLKVRRGAHRTKSKSIKPLAKVKQRVAEGMFDPSTKAF